MAVRHNWNCIESYKFKISFLYGVEIIYSQITYFLHLHSSAPFYYSILPPAKMSWVHYGSFQRLEATVERVVNVLIIFHKFARSQVQNLKRVGNLIFFPFSVFTFDLQHMTSYCKDPTNILYWEIRDCFTTVHSIQWERWDDVERRVNKTTFRWFVVLSE